MKIQRRKQAEIQTGLTVEGGGPQKKVPTVGAGVAIALSRALDLKPGEHVVVLEYGEVIGRAVRTETAAVWLEGGGVPA